MAANVTISLAQMDCRLGEPEVNFARAASFVAEAARRGSDLVLLPELWSTAYALDAAASLASPLASHAGEEGWVGRVAARAAAHRIYIGWSLREARGGRFLNCFALYGPDGTLCGAYRKVHLFKLMDEEKYLTPGE